ncbi:MAG: CocE/NonD family hydrolase [Acidimicrobiales bacterium]
MTSGRKLTLVFVSVIAFSFLAACARTTGAIRTATSTSHPAQSAPAPSEPPPPATPHPFGRLSCKPSYGVRFCAGNGTTERVPSFDGVPLDADVTLPATGRGPFPLIVMLHGLGASKTEFEATSNNGVFNNVTFASKGWAVLTYTARGFGNSCGTAASRAGTPGCAKGWIHLADQRYEVRDTQYLAGLLVDEGLVKPKIAVAGLSYGAGQTLELAMLKDRVRLPSGQMVPWVSPIHHVPMSIGAAYAEWGWDDLATALVPNGHLSTAGYSSPAVDLSPIGVEKQSWDSLLYGVTASAYLHPKGIDPGADITTWYHALNAGEPYARADLAYLKQLQAYHSPIGIPMPAGGPAPTVMQNGWTDTLFPVSEALHWSERYRATHVNPPLLQIFDDVGHGWAQNKPADQALQTKKAIAFIDAEMLSHTRPETGVIAIGTTCPATAPSGPVLTASSWAGLKKGSITFATGRNAAQQVVTSTGGTSAVAAALNPAYAGHPYCQSLPAARGPGTASYVVTKATSRPLTLIGPYQVTLSLRVTGNYPELIGRLWDVNPRTGTRQLVEAGVFRPSVNQAAGTPKTAVATTRGTFELSPNLWTLPKGHQLVLELVGSNAPWFRASNGRYSMRVLQLSGRIGQN